MNLDEFEQWLWDTSPMVQEMKQQFEQQFEKEKAEGRVKGTVETLLRLLVRDVQKRFPQLTELAQAKVKLVNEPSTLEVLYEHIQDATSVNVVQQLLVAISEQQG